VALILAGRWKERLPIPSPTGGAFTPSPAPHFLVRFHCAQHVLGGEIDFLMDTGADITTIMPDDRETICIPNRALVDGCPPAMSGIGGLVPIRYLHDITLQFPDPDGKPLEPIRLERISVLCPLRELRAAYRGTPSLLGRDFLSHGKIELSSAGVTFEWCG